MNELDPTRAALLALDFQNYGVHPQGYWASHGEPDWPAIARPAGHHCEGACPGETPSCPYRPRRGGLATREPGDEHDGPALRQRRRPVGGGQLGIGVLCTGGRQRLVSWSSTSGG